MAQFLLVSIKVTDPIDAAFTVDDTVNVYWDDSTDDFAVTLNGSAFTTSGTNLGHRNVNYKVLSGLTSRSLGYAVVGYSFCDGSDLIWFTILDYYPEYPFCEKKITANSPVCAVAGGAVCDIHFTGPPKIAPASTQSESVLVTVNAVSSNGAVRYGVRYGESYSQMTNTTGTFTLWVGDWTITAKDANDCTATINVKVLFKPDSTEHYRFTWATKQIGSGQSRDARVRIYEREYIGDVVEVDFGDVSPFTLKKPKQTGGSGINDKLYPIHPTSAVIDLFSINDYQFLPLFTQDNKKYRVVYEYDSGSGFTPLWQGFVDPNVYREDFINTPYIVEIQVSDNIRTLQNEPFTDEDGNLLTGSLKLIKVISFILKKTGLSLQIRSGINIFEENHNTGDEDDPLDQTYIDVACYRDGVDPFSCWQVLEAILRPFGARILQENNQWIIEEIDRAVDDYKYRVFDADGDYVSNGTTSNQVVDVKVPTLTDRAALIHRDHSLEVIPAYGKITITSKLNYIGSIVSGGFEKEDLLPGQDESFDFALGVFTAEEGFNGWTLRLNGTSGVSFGRVIAGRKGDDSRIGLRDDDSTRSVGAFYYSSGWSGNLRNAYIESAEKDYQYGPGDEFKFSFEYSTPAKSEYPFMVLRFVIKLGDQYLQQDLSWSEDEHIYRAYPPVTNSLQKYELSAPLPGTSVVVDTTVQVRIYFYAPAFYDFGLPPPDGGALSEGEDGIADLRDLQTADIDYDYRLDVRVERTVGSSTMYGRGFAELRYAVADHDPDAGVIQPLDYNASTNPKIWRSIGLVLENSSDGGRLRGLDRKFYIDNVTLDALINGQPPPEEHVISLEISKYINEDLPVELYNFDMPDIVNGKNMYNNYFRLSDGTPTALWARSGEAESLSLQEILLKVLGANHSAPTFRMTGSFINEFARIAMNNYIRIVKPGAALEAINTEFTSNLTGWSQSTLPALSGSWAWSSDNEGSAEVTLSGGSGTDSKELYQAVSHQGGYIELTVNVKIVPSAGNTREDVMWVLFYRGSDIIHTEKMKTFVAPTSESVSEFTYTAFAPGAVNRIGLVIKRAAGTGTCKYQVSQFKPAGKDISEVYQISDYQSEERLNTYSFELMQMSKTYISLSGVDTGGTNQSGGTTGRAHSSGYSTGYN